tara:strand:+ start:51518 stop:52174 length:657 start_codon:yes stop_codon:yes gene_type:complete
MVGLIIIPARKGSKRLKNKNKLKFLGKPLIEHTFNFAKKIKLSPYILLTTDDKEIFDIGIKEKILTPWLRPGKISKDNSQSISFVLHAINWFEKNFKKLDYIVLLQPTSPFRELKTLREMFKIFKKKKSSIATFTLNLDNKKNIYYVINKKKIYKNSKSKIKANISGNIYINSVNNIRKYKKIINQETIPYITNNKKEDIDIDTLKQFNLALKLDKKN